MTWRVGGANGFEMVVRSTRVLYVTTGASTILRLLVVVGM